MRLFPLLIIVLFLPQWTLAQISVETGSITDQRSDGFFSRLTIELKLTGAELEQGEGIRIRLDRAEDNLGTNLISEDTDEDFESMPYLYEQSGTINLELQNPPRQAETLTEISGHIEIFMPDADPDANILVQQFQEQAGKPIEHQTLEKAGIHVMAWTKDQFANQQPDEEDHQKVIEAARKEMSEESVSLLEGLMGLLGGFFELSDNSLAFGVEDPEGRLISMKFEDESGQVYDPYSRSIINNKTWIYEFEEPLPPTINLRLNVLTPEAVMNIPFKLTALPLP